MKQSKLELQWSNKNKSLYFDLETGKYEWVDKKDPRVSEPRILVEKETYGEKATENILIKGDNLLALKALQQDYQRKVKLIYIDPPFNTGARIDSDGNEVGYEDGLEHSIWLSMMSDRLHLLKDLLREDGSIFIHIDDTELGYLIVLCDEIFGRNNRIHVVTNKRGSVTGHKAINPGMVNITDFVLIYAKNKDKWKYKKLYKSRERNERYNNYVKNIEKDKSEWEIISLLDAFSEYKNIPKNKLKKELENSYEEELESFVMKNANAVIQLAYPDYNNVSKEAQQLIDKSKQDGEKIYYLHRENYPDIYLYKGQRLLFYSDRLFTIDGQVLAGEPLSNLWDDILPNDLHNEGQVTFRKGKKPEKLIKRIIDLASEENDIVLDTFAGSGTTGAAAHKMNRKWIMCELSNQSDTHIVPRLNRVIKGEDKSGITKDTNWNGGGGFKYFELGDSLFVRDNDLKLTVINPKMYNGSLIQAVLKVEGFGLYHPENGLHGKSGTTGAHVTEQYLTQPYIDTLLGEIGAEAKFLVIYAKTISNNIKLPENVEIKRIPDVLLKRFTV